MLITPLPLFGVCYALTYWIPDTCPDKIWLLWIYAHWHLQDLQQEWWTTEIFKFEKCSQDSLIICLVLTGKHFCEICKIKKVYFNCLKQSQKQCQNSLNLVISWVNILKVNCLPFNDHLVVLSIWERLGEHTWDKIMKKIRIHLFAEVDVSM